MQKIIHNISLDLSQFNKPSNINIVQGDKLSRIFQIQVLNNGSVYNLTDGITARVRVKKPDLTQIFDDCTIQDNKVIFDITEQMLTAVGKVFFEISLYQEQSVLTSFSYYINVTPSVIDARSIVSSDEFKSLNNALEVVENYTNRLNILTNGVTASESNINTIATNVNSLEEQISYMQDDIDDLESKVTSIESNTNTYYIHSKTGSVHSLTNANGSNFITFKATADFNSGDTFTVNNQEVMAMTTNAQNLTDNFFVSGTTVTAVLDNDVLNFKSAGGTEYNFPPAVNCQNFITLSNTYINDIQSDSLGNIYCAADGVYKFASDGTLLWHFTSTAATQVNCLAITSDFYVYAGCESSAIIRLDPSGNQVRTVNFDGLTDWSNVAVDYITCDSDGNVYVAGNRAVYYSKYNSSFTMIWRKTLSPSYTATGLEISVEQDGFLYLVKQFPAYRDLYKFYTNGDLGKNLRYQISEKIMRKVKVNSNGYVYLLVTNAVTNKTCLEKLNSNFQLLNSVVLNSDTPDTSILENITIDSNDNIYVSSNDSYIYVLNSNLNIINKFQINLTCSHVDAPMQCMKWCNNKLYTAHTSDNVVIRYSGCSDVLSLVNPGDTIKSCTLNQVLDDIVSITFFIKSSIS